jgi:cysteinyl-tRNA synthetase
MATVTSFDNTLKRFKSYTPRNTKVRREFRDIIQESMQSFVSALENDIDTLSALTTIFEFITLVNRDIDDESLTTKEVSSVIDIMKSWDMVLGVMNWDLLSEALIPENITTLAEERIEAKKNKDFARADEIRKEVESLGFIIIDSKEGFVIEKK